MTRNRISRLFLVTATAFAPAVAVLTVAAPFAYAGGADGAAGDKKKKDGKETELQKHMTVIEDAMKKLRRSLRAADQNEASLKSIAEIKQAAAKCKELVPAMASSVPAAEREKFIASYKKDMEKFIEEVGKMESAVKAGKNDDAFEIHKKLKDVEDEGHEKYNK